MLRLLKLAALVAAFVFLAPMMVAPASAHDWYVGKNDPVTGGSCCTTSANDAYGDCGLLKIEKGMLDAVDEGYRLRMTAEQAQKINPLRKFPVDTLIPWNRVQESGDGNWHVCLPQTPGTTKYDFFCFFAPANI